jgi:hypothetical protein
MMDRLEIIETLKHFPNALEAALAGLPETTLRNRPVEGEWSIMEVVGHLVDNAALRTKHFYMVWSQTDPLLPGYDREAGMDGAFQDANIEDLLATLRRERARTVEILTHAVDWTRIGMQRGVGRRSLKQLAERVIAHEADHLAQIEALKTAAATPR